MKQDIIPMIQLSICFLSLFGLSEVLYYFLKVPVEWSRKVSHIGTGFLTMLFPVWLHSHWSVLILCGSFFVILVVSKKMKLLQSINGIKRESHGSASYPIIVYICFVAWQLSTEDYKDPIGLGWFYLPILTMALADPTAAFVGSRWPIGKFRIGIDTKSFSGCLAFFSVAFSLAVLFLEPAMAFFPSALIFAFVVSLAGTLAEALSSKGFDNFTIPAAVLISLTLCLPLVL